MPLPFSKLNSKYEVSDLMRYGFPARTASEKATQVFYDYAIPFDLTKIPGTYVWKHFVLGSDVHTIK